MTEHLKNLKDRWWVNAATPVLNKKPHNKKIVDGIHNFADLMGVDKTDLDSVLKQLSPRKSKTYPESVVYYENSYKYQKEKLTRTSSGSFIRKLFPDAPDKLVEAFYLFYKSNISFNAKDFVFHEGDTREDFKNAFVNYVKTSSSTYKSISNSCMRYNFNFEDGVHPAEAYASGDFKVFSIRNRQGKTRARVVVRVRNNYGEPIFSPNTIYASCEYSGDLLKTFIENRTTHQHIISWNGAKLLKIKLKDRVSSICNSFLCPFVDNVRFVVLKEGFLLLYTFVDHSKPNDIEYDNNSTSGCVVFRKE